MLTLPYFLKEMIDSILEKNYSRSYWMLGLMFGMWMLRSIALSLAREVYEVRNIDHDIPFSLSQFSLGKFLGFSIGQHTNENSGVKQHVMQEGENSLQEMIMLSIYSLIPMVAETAASLLFMWIMGWEVALVMTTGILLFAVFSAKNNDAFLPPLKRARKLSQNSSSMRTEHLRNVNLILTEAQEKKSLHESVITRTVHMRYAKQVFLLFLKRIYAIRGVFGLFRHGALLVAVIMIAQGKYSVGSLAMFFTWITTSSNHLENISMFSRKILSSRTKIQKYFDMLDQECAVKEEVNPIEIDTIEGPIEFRNVSFSYPKRIKEGELEDLSSPSLHNVSFRIEKGQTVGIVGESGSGKSTLAQLLIRAYDPQKGQILIGGNDARLLRTKQLRESIGFVNQDVMLFDETLEYNITYGMNGKAKFVKEEDLIRISKLASLHTFIDSLPDKFKTFIGERGTKLSGGERQRLGIARAIIKNPTIMVFDEATSALDSENEWIVKDSIMEVSKGKTAIIIAHRLSTIINADKILVFQKGSLVGKGTHEELLRTCPYYENLVSRQMIAHTI